MRILLVIFFTLAMMSGIGIAQIRDVGSRARGSSDADASSPVSTEGASSRRNRGNRSDVSEGGDGSSSRGDRAERGERGERGDRGERPARGERSNRAVSTGRGGRNREGSDRHRRGSSDRRERDPSTRRTGGTERGEIDWIGGPGDENNTAPNAGGGRDMARSRRRQGQGDGTRSGRGESVRDEMPDNSTRCSRGFYPILVPSGEVLCGRCDVNATYTRPPRGEDRDAGGRCNCNFGFKGDGLVCIRDDDMTPQFCDLNARFDTIIGRCVCNTGWMGSGELSQFAENCVKCSPFAVYKPGSSNHEMNSCICQNGFETIMKVVDINAPGGTRPGVPGLDCTRVCPRGFLSDPNDPFNCQAACAEGFLTVYDYGNKAENGGFDQAKWSTWPSCEPNKDCGYDSIHRYPPGTTRNRAISTAADMPNAGWIPPGEAGAGGVQTMPGMVAPERSAGGGRGTRPGRTGGTSRPSSRPSGGREGEAPEATRRARRDRGERGDRDSSRPAGEDGRRRYDGSRGQGGERGERGESTRTGGTERSNRRQD